MIELMVSAMVASVVLGGSSALLVASRRRARAARALHTGEGHEHLDPGARSDLVRMQRALHRSRGEAFEGGELGLSRGGEVSPAAPPSSD